MTAHIFFFSLVWTVFLLNFSAVDGANEDEKRKVSEISEFLIKEVNRDNIKENLRTLTLHPHLAGTPESWKTANWIAQKWKSQGLDEVHLIPYNVLLSYPDKTKPNYAKIFDDSGTLIWKSQGRSPSLRPSENLAEEILPDFNAYSPPGTVRRDIVYANFGSEADFRQLAKMGINITGRIVIARYGKVYRGNIAKAAEDRGALGVLLYSDPQQYSLLGTGTDETYPNTVFMPGQAASFGSVYLNDGDPLTPYYPSTDGAFRIPEEEAELPKIPIMPLGYNDAEQILKRMTGERAPLEWQGGLNVTYRIGPGLMQPGWKVEIEVHTHPERSTIYNVVGTMKGEIEPDRYVILGNHYDAWIYGAVDPSSGTAAMVELSRTLSQFRNTTGWAPRRTIVFCAWGAEEYGLIGSTEWVEHFGKQLSDRTVAYVNLDLALAGNYSLRASSVPLLYEIVRESAKQVPNPDEKERNAGRLSVYDSWVDRQPNLLNVGKPELYDLGGETDYKGFQHFLGIPSMESRYTHKKGTPLAEPLYHTLYESFYLVSELYDKKFDFQAAVVQVWGIGVTSLSDSMVIPFSLGEYVTYIDNAQKDFVDHYGDIISHKNVSLEYFLNATIHFDESVKKFEEIVRNLDLKNPLQVRKINDQLMMVERSFIVQEDLPDRPLYRHILMAHSVTDNYSSASFGTLTSALNDLEDISESEKNLKWRHFEEQLSIATYCIETAAKVLSDDLW